MVRPLQAAQPRPHPLKKTLSSLGSRDEWIASPNGKHQVGQSCRSTCSSQFTVFLLFSPLIFDSRHIK